jgi:hypothetical protein
MNDEGMLAHTPPGWPAQISPPDSVGWVRTAQAWLLDLCPPDYRGYAVLGRHPVALAFLTAAHLEAGLAALRHARGLARATLSERLPPPEVSAVLEVLDHEEVRLLAAGRGVSLVTQALAGQRQVPRL